METKTTHRPINVIAGEIFADWKNMDVYAKPYADAMLDLTTITDHYGADSGKEIVLRFLVNATKWRGETAKRIKAELKKMVGIK